MNKQIYIEAKKNLKKTNSLINDVFIKEQQKEINDRSSSESDISIIQDDAINRINKKLDILLLQNNNLKKINMILLDTIKFKCDEIKNLLLDNKYSDLEEIEYINSINDIEF